MRGHALSDHGRWRMLVVVLAGVLALSLSVPGAVSRAAPSPCIDSFGYTCQTEASSFLSATTVLPLTGDDAAVSVNLPFSFPFYGQTYQTVFVWTNGTLNFLSPINDVNNTAIPSVPAPNASIYALWDDLLVDASASVHTDVLGVAPNRQVVIEWRNVRFFGDVDTNRLSFEVVLHENGEILVQYAGIDTYEREQGNSATTGIENHTGTVGIQFSFNEAVLRNDVAVRYTPPGVVSYNFSGFFAPVDNLDANGDPIYNKVKGGASVPLKFSLDGYQGTDIFAASSPSSKRITCDGTATSDPIEEIAPTGASGLTYDSSTDQYHYVWKTEKGWKGTCRVLTLTLQDASVHTAYFDFR